MKKFDQRIDTIRVISMLLVIVIHVSNYYCRAFHDISIFSFTIATIYNALARMAVPIFFMISGALLLSKPYDEKKNRKRIMRMIVVLFVFTIIYCLWDYYYLNKTIPSWIHLIFKPERKMLWFLYVMIGFYIAFPFIKAMVDGMDERLDKKFVCLWFLLNGITYVCKFIFKYKIKYHVPILNGTYYLGYFLMGYLILKYKDKIDYKKYNWVNILIIIVNVAISVSLTVWYLIVNHEYDELYMAYRTLFINCISIASFILMYANLKDKEYKCIRFISPYSFGVYLFHGMVLNVMVRIIPYKLLSPIYMIPILSTLIFMITFVIVYIVKKIPYVKDYI